MPGGAPGAGPGPDPELKKNLDTWFIISIVNIFCCFICWPLAAVAAFMAHTGKGLYASGDVAGAQSKLKTAKICVFVNAGLAVLFGILYGVLMATGMAGSLMSF